MRVLVLEDDPLVSRGLERLLAMSGHEVICVPDTRGARASMRRGRFDAILADHGLGGMESGLDLLRWVSRECPEARRVLMSGSRERGHKPIVHAFLIKPFGLAELNQALDAQASTTGVPNG